jgi:hypothetical protein
MYTGYRSPAPVTLTIHDRPDPVWTPLLYMPWPVSGHTSPGCFVRTLHQHSAGDGPDQILGPFGHGHYTLLA